MSALISAKGKDRDYIRTRRAVLLAEQIGRREVDLPRVGEKFSCLGEGSV